MVRKGFEGCISFVDETIVPFEQHPSHKGDFYFDRNGQYSLNAQEVVGDKNRRYSGKPNTLWSRSICQQERVVIHLKIQTDFQHLHR
ncbi:hypothetical protein EDD21DRAFT_341317, partial [Dissophora ornata]